MRPATTVRLACAAALAAALVLLPAAAASDRGLARLKIAERDFRIKAPKQVRAGEVELVVHNKGPDAHELIVVRVGPHELPLRSDGLTVDEEALDKREVAILEPDGPGTTRKIRVDLAQGRYILFCNMSGHYLGGMHSLLVVH